ncbi:MAG TPA: XRE family transcriptional regulator [Bacteroidetes bacterium]|nr:HTH-type transcriptional regulator SinR [bacterium BMS3Bbin04]HDO64954.1 XRE family transcriptional regulator [Bacteroidota bacterium]HEX04079.1 XRE family transcriptional regulator [Bacteroidota bacterium]
MSRLKIPVDTAKAKALGDTLREFRKELGLSQEEYAFRCGLDRTYISGVERGVRNPTYQVICRFVSKLDVSLEAFFRRVDAHLNR